MAGQLVTARPPSTLYRLNKFVKKHRGQVIMTIVLCMTAIVGIASVLRGYQADSQKRAVYAAAAYSSIINELNILSVNRQSGWTHRGLDLVAKASSIDTPLRDARQLRDWTVSMLTIPDFDMDYSQTVHRFAIAHRHRLFSIRTFLGSGIGHNRCESMDHDRVSRSRYGCGSNG